MPYFLAAVAILGAWLIATPQLVAEVQRLDFRPFFPRATSLFNEYLVPVARRFGVTEEVTLEQRSQLASIAPVMAKQVANGVFVPLIGQLTVGAGPTLILSVIGIMVTPLLQHFHFSYWSPAALMYALVFPYLVGVTFTTLAVVIMRTMGGALAANAETDAAAVALGLHQEPTAPAPAASPPDGTIQERR